MRRLMPQDVEVLVSRVPSGASVTPDTLAAMEANLATAAALFPLGVNFSAVGYGCTSGTAQIGASNIAARIREGVATPKITEPVSALIAACQHLKIRQIGLISPYVASVSDRLRTVLSQAGITADPVASFNQAEERTVARIAPEALYEAAAQVAPAKPLRCGVPIMHQPAHLGCGRCD